VSEAIRKRYVFHGRVQGVGFRMFCRDEALRLRLRGWVRNRPDGSVEAEAEGPAGTLVRFVERIQTGHSWARVDSVEEMDCSPRGDESEQFEIAF